MSPSFKRDELVMTIMFELEQASFRIRESGEQDSFLLRTDTEYKSAWRLERIKRPDFDIVLYYVPDDNSFYMSYHSRYTGYMVHDSYIELPNKSFYANRNLTDRTGWTDEELRQIISSIQNILPDKDKRPLDD